MKLDFLNPAHLKIQLLSEGIRLSPNFFKFFTNDYQGSPYHYSKDNIFTQNYPHHMILKLNTNCAINIDNNSPWCLEADKDVFFITHKNKKITNVYFRKTYPWLKKQINTNTIVEDIGFMTTPNSLNIFIGKGCFFFAAKKPCKFCGFQDTRKCLKDKDHITRKNLQRLFKILNKYDHEINQIYFVGATYSNFDNGFQKVIDIVKIAKGIVPKHIDLIVTNFPPKDLSLIKKLKEAGTTRISFAIETATEKKFATFCPGKSKYYGHQNFQKALIYATKHFPMATYASIIQGLDSQKDLIEFMWKMHYQGIMPTMNIYYHSPYSKLKNTKKRPPVEYLYNVAKNHQKIFAKSNIRLFSYGADRHCLDWEAYRQMI